MHPYQRIHPGSRVVPHLVKGQWRFEQGQHTVTSPYTGELMLELRGADRALVDEAVAGASAGAKEWAQVPIKERTRVLFQVRANMLERLDELRATISYESGKTLAEAEAGVMKGVEVLEFALSLQNLDQGGKLEVSRGVHCEVRRVPLGVVAGITPFNFPAMVPMWMMPIALALGNAFVWKPSEKVPMTSQVLGECFTRAGLPPGALTIVQGGVEAVNALVDHPEVRAVGFVGSTPVAKAVYTRATGLGKRALCLGGAKNHIILMPDADPDIAAAGITDSFTGCAGQRCMAASVVLAVGKVDGILAKVAERAAAHRVGETMGAIITRQQVDFLRDAIARSEREGSRPLVDGRAVTPLPGYERGNWLGPTILDGVRPGSEAATKELFGPVLSVMRVASLDEALAIDDGVEFGNATSGFTSSGAVAEEVARRASSGMIGINIGVPVPREPFSFGGTYESKYGAGDITGPASLSLWTDLKKVTTKWTMPKDQNWMS
ncbi:MAG: aldehyde dehydrogenase family protein [Myxococcaceae bacterium]|nr:aldehyde dehydrogenase family protein [Myxococcaceae bacterium]